MSKGKTTTPEPTPANRKLYILLGLVVVAALAFFFVGRPLLFGDDTSEPIQLPGVGAQADEGGEPAAAGPEGEAAPEGEAGPEGEAAPPAETPRPRDPFRQLATE